MTGGHDTNGGSRALVHVGPAPDDDDGAATPVRTGTERVARNWALACHLAPLGAWAVGLPGVLGPLIVWMIKRDQLEAVDRHGREALNFQITLLLAQVALAAFAFITFGLGMIVTVPLLIAISVGGVVCMVLAAIRANEGRMYRYPFTWRPL